MTHLDRSAGESLASLSTRMGLFFPAGEEIKVLLATKTTTTVSGMGYGVRPNAKFLLI